MLTADLDGLRAIVEGAEPSDLPAIIGRLAEAEAIARARMITPRPLEAAAPISDDDAPLCITVPEAARLLGVSVPYLARLARERKIPTIKLPALDRGTGETRATPADRMVRIPLSALREMIARRTDPGFVGLSKMLYPYGHERNPMPQDQKGHGRNPGRTSRNRRSPLDHGKPLGAGRKPHSDSDGEAT
jgi:Helix-turn-helix domain